MADFAFTDAQITAAEEKIAAQLASGAQSIEINGRKVSNYDPLTYLKAISEIAAARESEDDGGMLKPKFKAAT